MSRVHSALQQADQTAFTGLIQQLFQDRSVVAMIDVGPARSATGICERIAVELGRSAKNVVIVSGQAVVERNPAGHPDDVSFHVGAAPNISMWPSPLSDNRVPLRAAGSPEQWLNSLLIKFDTVLIDCPSVESLPGSAAIAAMAHSAVLVIDALHTPKQQIQLDQRTLQLSGVKLAGSILVNAK